jgi:DNA invertase Pin-like site-specific DNA recombinase
MLGPIAEFEGDLIGEPARAGQEAARRRGRHPGWPWALDRETWARVQRLRASGHSIPTIAGKLDVSKSAVARAMRAT